MYCLHPILVRKWSDPSITHYYKLKDKRTLAITCNLPHKKTDSFHYVPCGKCVGCLSRKRNEWTYRLQRERDMSDYSFFVTLTYDQEHIPIKIHEDKPYFVFEKSDVQKYMKRVRYFMNKISADLSCQYLGVSEYGGIGKRPHYHFLVFVKNDRYQKHMTQFRMILRDCWQLGFTTITYPEDARVHYITKYCVKGIDKVPDGCIDDVFILASKRPYIGASYESILDRQINQSLESKVYCNGYPQAMPRIFRQKIGAAALGGVGMSESDPRLSIKLEESYKKQFMRGRSSFDEGEFHQYVNMRLATFEKLAIKRQLQRNEKL